MADREAEFDERAANDEQLLVRFRKRRDERAFAELARRYESMVFGVARQMLGCRHAAEDVFQATFLVLARDAGRIRNRPALASWLYGVAYRISARLAKQRAARPVTLKEEPMVHSDPLQEISDRVEQQRVHDELHRLPDRIRAPMVLRYLQGKSNLEVAEALNLSESAVEGRLKRGRNQLRIRLARHGVGFVAAVSLLEMMNSEAVSCPAGLASDTVAACLATDPARQTINDNVTHLVEQEMVKMMTTSVSKAVLASCLTAGALAVGWIAVPKLGDALAGEGAPANDEIVAQATPNLPVATNTPVAIVQSTPADARAKDDSSSNRSGRFDLKKWSPSEEKILATLEKTTRLEFSETPLSEVLDFLEDYHGIQIEIDRAELEDQGIDVNSHTITKNLSNISLRSGLRLVLHDLDLTYIIRDEVLMITSQEQAEVYLDTRVYKLPWQPGSLQELVNVITSTVSPHSWSEAGGPGHIAAFNDGLIVSHSQEVHNEINQLLEQLARLHEGQ